MTNAKKVLNQELEKLPYIFLEDLVARKLTALGVSSSKELAPKLIEHARSGNKEKFIWEDGNNTTEDIFISITDEDLAELKIKIQKFNDEELPKIVGIVAEKSAAEIFVSLKQNWPQQHAWEQATVADFRDNLEARWGKGLNLLRMLVAMCLDLGAENLKLHSRSKKRREANLSNVLIRLHARACQVSAEIITLLENGFADGAMARWRTLHEIGVVATFITDFGEETAERYVAHQFVEAKAGMDDYSRSNIALGYEPLSKRSSAKILRDYEKVLQMYGKEFCSPYGWAAKDLRKKKPIFSDLEAAAGRALMRSHYKMASYNVHASAKGIFFRLGSLDPLSIVAGASNAGLSEPAQNLAVSLTIITSLLFGPRWEFEDIVALKTLAKIRDEIPNAFIRAERKLQRDENYHQKKRSEGKRRPSQQTQS